MKLKRTVRIGHVGDQERWRREDCARMTPNERVEALIRFRYDTFPEEMRAVRKKVVVHRIGGRDVG